MPQPLNLASIDSGTNILDQLLSAREELKTQIDQLQKDQNELQLNTKSLEEREALHQKNIDKYELEKKSDQEALELEKKSIRIFEASAAGRVELEVGGQRFVTTKETLMCEGENSTFFQAMFSGGWSENEGPIIIDRDPASFEIILSYLRYHCDLNLLRDMCCNNGTCQLGIARSLHSKLQADVDFYGLPKAKAKLKEF